MHGSHPFPWLIITRICGYYHCTCTTSQHKHKFWHKALPCGCMVDWQASNSVMGWLFAEAFWQKNTARYTDMHTRMCRLLLAWHVLFALWLYGLGFASFRCDDHAWAHPSGASTHLSGFAFASSISFNNQEDLTAPSPKFPTNENKSWGCIVYFTFKHKIKFACCPWSIGTQLRGGNPWKVSQASF